MPPFRRTEPVAGSNLVSAVVRDNFQALEDQLAGATAKAQSTPDLTVKVEAFVYLGSDGKTRKSFAGGNSPAIVAPSTNPRIALLTIDDAASLAWTYGAEAASPAAPNYLTNKVPICEVFERVAQTSIQNTDDSTNAYLLRQATHIWAPVTDAFPAGTRMVFDQAAAPVGWTRDTGITDRVLRIVSGSAGVNGGGSWTISGLTHAHTHTMANHTHTLGNHGHALAAGGDGAVGGGTSHEIFRLGTTLVAAPLGSGTTVDTLDYTTTTSNVASGAPSTNTSDGASTTAVASDGAWRPLTRDMLIAAKD